MNASRRVRIICGRESVNVEAKPSWNILFLRQVAASQLGVSGERQLVQAGRILPDSLHLHDLQPVEDTCFHLTIANRSSDRDTEPTVDGSSWRSWRRFFVYCRTCGIEKEARLRLSCGRCGSGSFMLPSPAPVVHSFSDLGPHLTGRCPDCENRGDQYPAPMAYVFRCVSDEDASLTHTCVPLPRLRGNWYEGGYSCLACMERSPTPFLHFPCTAEHCLCLPCFRDYAEEAMNNQRFRLHRQHGWTLSCPARCGPNAVLDDPHHFLLLGPDFYSQMKARGAEAVLAHEGGGFCPNRECGEAWLPGEMEVGALRCRMCGWSICRRCRETEHEGDCDAQEISENEDTSDVHFNVPFRPPSPSSLQSTQTIRAISRRCPGCQIPTERSGGCMHMTCSQCSFEWCWICRCAWSPECQANHWFA